MKEEAKKKNDCGAEKIFSLAWGHRRSMFGLYLILLPASPEMSTADIFSLNDPEAE